MEQVDETGGFGNTLVYMTACTAAQQPASSEEEQDVQIPNPFVDCETLEEAEALAGFELTVPASAWEGTETFRAQEGTMVEVICTDEQQQLRIRKALSGEDISGDYNQYPQEQTVMAGEREVTLRGQDDLVYVAVWSQGEASFSITVSDGAEQQQLLALIEEIS